MLGAVGGLRVGFAVGGGSVRFAVRRGAVRLAAGHLDAGKRDEVGAGHAEVEVAQLGLVGRARTGVEVGQGAVGTGRGLGLGNAGLRVGDVAELDRAGRAGLLAGDLDDAVADVDVGRVAGADLGDLGQAPQLQAAEVGVPVVLLRVVGQQLLERADVAARVVQALLRIGQTQEISLLGPAAGLLGRLLELKPRLALGSDPAS